MRVRRTPTATVCPTTGRTRPPACCAPAAPPARPAADTPVGAETETTTPPPPPPTLPLSPRRPPAGRAGLAAAGNGDGVKDSQQVAVASTRDLPLVAGSRDGKLIPDSNARITELVRSDAPAKLPKGMEMPLGLTSFKVSLAEGPSTESFSLYADPALGANGYWVKDSTGTWVNLASEP